jgi:hypothetical protein
MRVDYLLRGMPVPAGKHSIEFRFEPATYIMGGRISLWLTIALYVALLAGIGFTVLKKKQ